MPTMSGKLGLRTDLFKLLDAEFPKWSFGISWKRLTRAFQRLWEEETERLLLIPVGLLDFF